MNNPRSACIGRAIAAVAVLSVTGLWTAAPVLGGPVRSFQPLGDLPGSDFFSRANDVSADGSVVVGASHSASGAEAFRWENGVMTGLGDLPGGPFSSTAKGVSADGTIIVGTSYSTSEEPFRWEDGVMTGLGHLPDAPAHPTTKGYAVSANGPVVVGDGECVAGWEAFRWEDGVMTGLGDLPGGAFSSRAYDVSADGSVVVGQSSVYAPGYTLEAFRWEAGVMTGLGDLPEGDFRSRAFAVSADGSVVVGYGESASGTEAFRWENGVMTGLGDLAGSWFESEAYAVSADGSVVVGMSRSAWGNEAFVWDAANGMQSLRELLGVDLTGWTYMYATGISADGLTAVGYGHNPDGLNEAWIAYIPEPATFPVMIFGALLAARRRR